MKISLNNNLFHFPGGAVDRTLPANAGGMACPWSGKIPRAAEQLSLGAAAAEPHAVATGSGT